MRNSFKMQKTLTQKTLQSFSRVCSYLQPAACLGFFSAAVDLLFDLQNHFPLPAILKQNNTGHLFQHIRTQLHLCTITFVRTCKGNRTAPVWDYGYNVIIAIWLSRERILEQKQNVCIKEYHARITFSFSCSNLHDMTNSITEIPEVREQLAKCPVTLHLYLRQHVGKQLHTLLSCLTVGKPPVPVFACVLDNYHTSWVSAHKISRWPNRTGGSIPLTAQSLRKAQVWTMGWGWGWVQVTHQSAGTQIAWLSFEMCLVPPCHLHLLLVSVHLPTCLLPVVKRQWHLWHQWCLFSSCAFSSASLKNESENLRSRANRTNSERNMNEPKTMQKLELMCQFFTHEMI